VRIKGLKSDESDALLEFLYRQATVPEYQLRVKWQPNTLVMWDNRSVQHYAVHDYYPARRTMERVTVKGDRPVGVTGPYVADTVEANGMVKPMIAEGTRPGPKRAFDRY
jgi:taurine dioxygenase